MMYRFKYYYFRIPILLRLLLTVMILMISFGLIIHMIEPNQFPSVFDGVWWAFVTGSTVGYGDYVPSSTTGKVLTILLILSGGGVVTFYMATISAKTVKFENSLSKGEITYKGKNHIVLIGWNQRTKQLIQMFSDKQIKKAVVLIDKTLTALPENNLDIHFIRGDSTEDDILQKANISKACSAIITSDPTKVENQADQQSILSTVAIRGNSPSITIITEILTEEQKTNALRAGANTIVRSNDFMSTLFFQELFRDTDVHHFDILLQVLSSQQFKKINVPNEIIGTTFLQCLDYFIQTEQLLIGIIKKGELLVNPPFTTVLDKQDELIVLTSLEQ
ncbi:potassium channel family protein [Aquibacillus salsiterrae]|uniref:Potassium channel family protein n=1 Tax=Aquibacillus salsiterrae TaxID=2950439 RepID=A0A9X3WH30_9BACI|nr:potassium channel family protein [Aquibacillus salsiterrae]MDC3418290.1 potassium channel family protein [Aquibacillus salsiterrae]